MIYLLSDLHGKMNFPGLNEYLDKATEDDLLIILGDIGLNFERTEENVRFAEQFLAINKKIAILDGNHDNFAYLNGFPEERWNGGTVNRLAENIVHLKRGNIYTMEGKSFFVFGGCKSSAKWKERGLWYPGEEPADEEFTFALEILRANDCHVDYILTHKYEQTPGKGSVSIKLQELTRFIDENVQFNKWYSGHWHTTGIIDEKHILIYDVLTKV